MVKVSVLVAVYNTVQYLPQCLDSLLAQTMGDFQVICVDDASTDDSLMVLESYAQRDSRIEVISLSENHGQAFARNQALKHVKGSYTCFLDSDDWLGKDALLRIVSAFEQDEAIDCVLFRCRYYYSEDRIEEYPMPAFETEGKDIESERMEGKEQQNKRVATSRLRYLSGERAFVLSLTWAIHGVYAVKTSIHQQYPYDDSALSCSDDNTTRVHFYVSRKVVECSAEYFYRQHAASVTHQVSLRRFDYLKANESMKAELQRLKVSPRLLAVYENERWKNVVGVYLFYWQHARELSDDDRRVALRVIRYYWRSIDLGMIYPENKNKLGFLSCRSSWIPEGVSWCLFRLQANLYFLLKKVMGRL